MQQTRELHWEHDFDSTLERARQEGRHVLLDFSAAPM
jgi:hypothetical protein